MTRQRAVTTIVDKNDSKNEEMSGAEEISSVSNNPHPSTTIRPECDVQIPRESHESRVILPKRKMDKKVGFYMSN